MLVVSWEVFGEGASISNTYAVSTVKGMTDKVGGLVGFSPKVAKVTLLAATTRVRKVVGARGVLLMSLPVRPRLTQWLAGRVGCRQTHTPDGAEGFGILAPPMICQHYGLEEETPTPPRCRCV